MYDCLMFMYYSEMSNFTIDVLSWSIGSPTWFHGPQSRPYPPGPDLFQCPPIGAAPCIGRLLKYSSHFIILWVFQVFPEDTSCVKIFHIVFHHSVFAFLNGSRMGLNIVSHYWPGGSWIFQALKTHKGKPMSSCPLLQVLLHAGQRLHQPWSHVTGEDSTILCVVHFVHQQPKLDHVSWFEYVRISWI